MVGDDLEGAREHPPREVVGEDLEGAREVGASLRLDVGSLRYMP